VLKAAAGYSYPALKPNVHAATLSIDRAHVADPRGFVATWVGVRGAENWVQGGLVKLGAGYGKPGVWEYVETMHAGQHVVRYLRPVDAGEQVHASVGNDGRGWFVSLNGRRYGSVPIGAGEPRSVTAAAESYTAGGGRNRWAWKIAATPHH
jgi:hypothetical protein